MLILVSIFYYILLLSARKIIIIDILISFLIFLFMIIKERKLILLFFTSIFSILVIPIASYTKMPGRIIEYLKNIDEKGIFGDRNDRLHLFFDENPKYGNNLYELLFGSNIDSPGLHNYFFETLVRHGIYSLLYIFIFVMIYLYKIYNYLSFITFTFFNNILNKIV